MATPLSLFIYREAFAVACADETKSIRRWNRCHNLLNKVFPLLDDGVTNIPAGADEDVINNIIALIPGATREETAEGTRWTRTPDPALSDQLNWWYNNGEDPLGDAVFLTIYGEDLR